MDELTETVTAYIIFCEDLIILRKFVHIFPNNKPWVSKSLKNIISPTNIALIQGDITRSGELHKQVKRELKSAKDNYKEKMQGLLHAGNSRPAWDNVKFIMDLQSKKCPISLAGKSDLANDVNIFRFVLIFMILW